MTSRASGAPPTWMDEHRRSRLSGSVRWSTALRFDGRRTHPFERALRLRDRGRRVRGMRARRPAVRGPVEPGARPRGGPAGLVVGRLHPHAGRARLPDRQPLLRLEVRVRARAPHGRAARVPRAREGAGRVEQHQRDDLPARQPDGLRALVLERGPAKGPLFDAFFTAVQEAGYELTEDVNGYKQEGFAKFDRNVHKGTRLSASRAYLHPVMDRPNLDVETFAFVTKIAFEGGRAVGVDYARRGRGSRRAHGGEVILCGGAIASPQLLQISGVGAADHLRGIGVDVVAGLPGVGENLQDHLEVYIQHSSTQPVSMAPYFKMHNRPKVGLEWLLRKSGPGATNHFEAGGFVRSNDEVEWPNLMYHFLPIAIRYDGTVPEGGGGHGYQVHVGPMYSDVRGTCKAVSSDPRKHPALLFNYLSTGNDRREWIEAVRVTRKILGAPAFEPFSGGELLPGAGVETGEQILDWVAKDAEAALHPSCTCRMGTDDMAVVDPLTMKVHGLEGLRVVDASVFPYVTNGNIYAPVMMTAEKAVDLILERTPLPAEPVEYYRHQGE